MDIPIATNPEIHEMTKKLIPRVKQRFRNYRLARYVLYITAFWAISIYLAPLTLEAGSVDDLDANANYIDHWGKWGDMAKKNPYSAAIYLFGDLNCHQKASRSLYVNDNQQPVCARDVGIAFGAMVGAIILFFVIRTPYVMLTFLSVIPSKARDPLLKRLPPWFVAALFAFPFIFPTGFDGFYQLLTDYESTNYIRLITGFFLGIILSWGFGSAFLSVTHPLPEFSPGPGEIHAQPPQQSLQPAISSSPPTPTPAPTQLVSGKSGENTTSSATGKPDSKNGNDNEIPPKQETGENHHMDLQKDRGDEK
jgi:uncharacterized membrane protein